MGKRKRHCLSELEWFTGDLFVGKESDSCYPIYWLRGTREFAALQLVHFKACCILGATEAEETSTGVAEELLNGYRLAPDDEGPSRKWQQIKLRRKRYGRRYPRNNDSA